MPPPLSTNGTETIYAQQGNEYTGSDTGLQMGGFVFAPGSHYIWTTPNTYRDLSNQLPPVVKVALQSDGDILLTVSAATAKAQNGHAGLLSDARKGSVPVGASCAVTVL